MSYIFSVNLMLNILNVANQNIISNSIKILFMLLLLLLFLLLIQTITKLTIKRSGHQGLEIDSFHRIPLNVNFPFPASFIFRR